MSMEFAPTQTVQSFEFDRSAATPYFETASELQRKIRIAELRQKMEAASTFVFDGEAEPDVALQPVSPRLVKGFGSLAISAAANTTAGIGNGIGDVAFRLFNDGQEPTGELAPVLQLRRPLPESVGSLVLAA